MIDSKGVKCTPEDIGDEIDDFLNESDLFYVFDENGNKYMVSAKVTFVPVEKQT